jgi:hypothetical protein
MVIVLVINFLAVWYEPEVGIHLGNDLKAGTSVAGNWRGLTTHKNFAGAASALCILLFLFDARAIKLPVRAGVIAAASCFFIIAHPKPRSGC